MEEKIIQYLKNYREGKTTLTSKELAKLILSDVSCSLHSDFLDWVDNKLLNGQLNRLKNDKEKWFYNHKPNQEQGKQDWRKHQTKELYYIYLNEIGNNN